MDRIVSSDIVLSRLRALARLVRQELATPETTRGAQPRNYSFPDEVSAPALQAVLRRAVPALRARGKERLAGQVAEGLGEAPAHDGPPLDPVCLDSFRSIVRTGSLWAAAAELGRPEASVRRDFGTLRTLLNDALVRRSGSGLVPTVVGSLLLEE